MINWASLIDLLDSARNPRIKRFHKESIFCENGSLTQTSQDSNFKPFIVAAHLKIDCANIFLSENIVKTAVVSLPLNTPITHHLAYSCHATKKHLLLKQHSSTETFSPEGKSLPEKKVL